jgi:hypothetical protein
VTTFKTTMKKMGIIRDDFLRKTFFRSKDAGDDSLELFYRKKIKV